MADHIAPPPSHTTHPDRPDHPTAEPDFYFHEPEPGEPRPHSDGPRPDVPEPGLPSDGPRDPVIGPHHAPPVIEPRYDPDSVLSFLADPSRQRKAVASANGSDPVSKELDGVIRSYENAWRTEKELNVERDAPDRLTSLYSYVEYAGTYLDESVRDRLNALAISLREYESERLSASHRDMMDSFTRSEFQRFAAETLTKVLTHADQIAREPKARGEQRKIEAYLGKLLGVADKIRADINNAGRTLAAFSIWRLEDRARDYFKRAGGVKDEVRSEAKKYSGSLQLFWGSIKTEAQSKLPKKLNQQLETLSKFDPTMALDKWHKLMKATDRKPCVDHTSNLVQTMTNYANGIQFLKETGHDQAYTTLQSGLGAIAEEMAQQLEQRG